jgi:uncharacterized membrane protein YfhO
VSNFSSTANGGLTTFLGALGCEHSTNAYGYNGATFLTSSMLSVKYIFSSTQLTENRLMSFFASNGNRYMYKLNYTLPLGFMVTDELEDLWDIKSTNPFLVQNDFLYTTTGYDGIFAQIPTESISSSSVRVKTLVDQQIYLYVMSGTESVNVYIDDECKNYSIKHNRIIDIGIINEGQEVRVTSDNTTDTISLLAYTIDEDRFIEAYELLNDEGLEISEFDDTHITGTITANEDGLMFTSIPYDKGWHVKVDGEKVDTVEIKEALIGIPLSAGTHTVTFSYTPQGYYLGVAITSICVIMLMIIYLAADSRYKKLWNRINSKWRK